MEENLFEAFREAVRTDAQLEGIVGEKIDAEIEYRRRMASLNAASRQRRTELAVESGLASQEPREGYLQCPCCDLYVGELVERNETLVVGDARLLDIASVSSYSCPVCDVELGGAGIIISKVTE
jgi:hypothetical protein